MGQATYSYGGAMNYGAGYLFLRWAMNYGAGYLFLRWGHELLGRLPIPTGMLDKKGGWSGIRQARPSGSL